MATILRLLIGIPIAGVITFFLFQLMRILIWVEEAELPEEPPQLSLEIAERVDEIQARVREVSIDDVSQVEPPPPPPQIEREVADAPDEDLSTVSGELPEFETPDMGGGDVNFNVSDRDAQPMVRIPPQYPPRAAERGTEGSCEVRFDVTPDGTPTNIETTVCDSIFARSTIRAVERWRYEPRIVDGQAVWRRGVVTRLDYELND